MRYYRYLNEDRSKKIDEDKFNYLLTENCSNILSKFETEKKYIYRGVSSSYNHIYIDPVKYTRKSANSENYYTLLFDHILSSWKDWPKRSKSLICTTNKNSANSYGKSYKVYPYNNAKIGICPAHDLWYSFELLHNLNHFNEMLIRLAIEMGYDLEENVDNVKTFIKEVDKLKSDPFKGQVQFIDSFFNNNSSFYDFLNDSLDPFKNGFKKATTSNIIFGKDNEVWIEGECLLRIDT